MTPNPKASRKFDVIVFGATGFTGRLVAEYLQKTYGSSVTWAMAGRSASKLEKVRDEMGVSRDIPLITADSADAQSLAALASLTKVVLTTVGPYQLYGTDLVGACVANGTDYVDLCGEPAWMRDIIDGFEDQAKESGARIVLSCGFDSIPFDMGVYFLQTEAKKRTGGPAPIVRGRVRKMKGTFSGGTAASFKASMARAIKEPEVMSWLKDPFALTPDFQGAPQPAGHKPIEEADLGSWAAPFIMASINTKNIHRSNRLMDFAYGKDFKYSEMMLTGPGEQGEKMANFVARDDSMSKNPPKPGEGPSKEERETGFYDVMFVGDMNDGSKIIAGVTGDKDPGYGSTSKMIAEAALTLALDVPQNLVGGGIYTPAPAMGDALITRLTKHAGLAFKIEA
jgi:short subunit dehydrogenase-like uncharacterized protein